MCGFVMYASWFTLNGLLAEMPPFVANENFVMMLVILDDEGRFDWEEFSRSFVRLRFLVLTSATS